MDIRSVKELLGKSKINANRGEYTVSLQYLIKALRTVIASPGMPPMEIRGGIREVIQLYSTAIPIRNLVKNGIPYSPGQEKNLYIFVKKVYNIIANKVEPEKYEDAFERKKKLDKYLILGKKYLSEGKVPEADQMFQGAVECYRDEKILFVYIAKMYDDAQQIPRAISFLQKAMEVDPNNNEAKELLRVLVAKRHSEHE